MYGLRYAEFVAPSTQAIQELSEQVVSPAERIEAQETRIQSQADLM